jgi:DNA ligase (NAD+)
VQFVLNEDNSTVESDLLKGKKIVVSGVFLKFSRNELKQSIEDNGGKVSSSISKNTDFLIAGDKMGPAKRAKAESLGIPIISEDDYINML